MSFLKKAVKFGSGVILAQLITAASIPLLSRIYSPSEFSLFGLYFSIASILMVFVTLKLENILPKEENIEEKIPTVIGVVYLTFLPLFFLAISFLYLIKTDFSYLDFFWAFLIVFSAITFNNFNILNILNVRQNKISLANKARIFRSSSAIFFQVILFKIKGGLFIGEFLGRFFGLLCLSKKKYYHFQPKQTLKLIKEKFESIKYMVSANFFNTLGLNLYPIIVLKFYDPIMVGKFFFVQKILSAPVTIVAQSISVVMLGDFREIISKDKNILVRKLNKITILFFFLSSIIFVFIGFFLKYFENFIFGNKWDGIYYFVFILIPFLVGQIAFSPFSQMLVLLKAEKLQFIWDLVRLFFVIISIFIPLWLELKNSFFYSLIIYSVSNLFMYAIHYSILIYTIRRYEHV
ncbi:MAG: lipopolysaccharide biosynthesis protein [Acinetobacter gandensis]|uniref:lipopolysaccharide biosynthesis protein n=1 Tax=Acinetobacter gandensis TaxID=1443941 RepID=UPI003D00CABE